MTLESGGAWHILAPEHPSSRHGERRLAYFLARFQLNLASRVTSTVISVIYSKVSSYSHQMTLNDRGLGFSKHPYLQRSIRMATQGEVRKLHPFLPPGKINATPNFGVSIIIGQGERGGGSGRDHPLFPCTFAESAPGVPAATALLRRGRPVCLLPLPAVPP